MPRYRRLGGILREARRRQRMGCPGYRPLGGPLRTGRQRYGVNVVCSRLEESNLRAGELRRDHPLGCDRARTGSPVDTMLRVARLLKPGGVVGILTPNLDGLFAQGRASHRLVAGGLAPCAPLPVLDAEPYGAAGSRRPG